MKATTLEKVFMSDSLGAPDRETEER